MDVEVLVNRARSRRRLPRPELRRVIREEASLTQADLASALGVGRASISRYETGVRTPTGETLDAYVELLARLSVVS